MTITIGILASGNGSNFQAIAQAITDRKLDAKIGCLIYDKEHAYVKERAKHFHIPSYFVDVKQYPSKEDFEKAIVEHLQEQNVQLVVLAGYMKVLGKTVLHAFPQKIINIHPSLLPLFKGKSGIKDAFEAKVHQTGVTVHLVDEGIDTGLILAQKTVSIDEDDTLETLTEKIHAAEHELYPAVIQNCIDGRYYAIRID